MLRCARDTPSPPALSRSPIVNRIWIRGVNHPLTIGCSNQLCSNVFGGSDMGNTSLIRATLLIALLAAMGFVAAGLAPAAELTAVIEAPCTAC
jgi:hypothetical protein